ncbi:MAG: serine/threonine protein kinase [Myxococcota bacterium]
MSAEVTATNLPRKLGRYRLIRLLSKGGMAEIYEARRESNFGVEPKVAIKVIQPSRTHDKAFRDLFITEAQVGSTLEHQNLIQIQDFDQADNQFFLVMEYIEGMTLHRVIRISRHVGVVLPEGIIAEIGRQLCDGLHHAHRTSTPEGVPLGLVHRDIKPANLMISPQGVVKVLDFGLSSATIAPEKKGSVRGTWGYMAPEQMRGDKVTARTDIYALAAVLYELATLTPLFPNRKSSVVITEAERDEGARRANKLGPEYARLKPILVRALQRDPNARYRTAEEMGRALAELVPELLMAREQIIELQNTIMNFVSGGRPYAPPIVFEENDALDDALLKDNQKPKAGIWFPLILIPLLVCIVVFGIFQKPQETSSINLQDAEVLSTDLGDRYALPIAEPSEEANTDDLMPPEIPQAPRQRNSSNRQSLPTPPLEVPPVQTPTAGNVEPVQSGLITVAADRPAKIFINGQYVREAPLINYALTEGEHRIILARSSDVTQRKVFHAVIQSGQNRLYHWSFEEERWLRHE